MIGTNGSALSPKLVDRSLTVNIAYFTHIAVGDSICPIGAYELRVSYIPAWKSRNPHKFYITSLKILAEDLPGDEQWEPLESRADQDEYEFLLAWVNIRLDAEDQEHGR